MMKKEIQVGLEQSARSQCQLDDVCCGRFGRSTILRASGWIGEAVELEERALVLDGADKLRYSLGAEVDGIVGMPGLFNGLSGIGLSLSSPGVMVDLMSAGLFKPLSS